MKVLLLFSLLLYLALGHAQVEIPDNLPNANSMVQFFRGPFQNKIINLSKFYDARLTEKTIHYLGDKDGSCHHFWRKAHSTWSKITRAIQISDTEFKDPTNSNRTINAKKVREVTNFFNCYDHNNRYLREDVIIVGENPQPISMKSFQSAERDFSLKKSEFKKVYILSDDKGVQIFKMILERGKEGINERYYAFGKQFLLIIKKFHQDYTEIIYSIKGYGVLSYNRKNSRWTKEDTTGHRLRVSIWKSPIGKVVFQAGKQRVSEDTFFKSFGSEVDGDVLNLIKKILKYMINFFPGTDLSASSAGESKFDRELRLMIIKMKDGGSTNYSQVQRQLQEWQRQIKSSNIKVEDKRRDEDE